ncbi:hypothetical protein A3D08_01310 [Candidatus Roizmanbacteria bacterium RIFCSPHIGHO2_02_FULL_43_11]|uniref:Uncharacterized protein n=1 Tax=Candidatus Roizmanbacteria bacterium RIFCSPHIGHO2_02_FULL_43_11 TaxID=1802043 RepID=A0A1F7HLH7_9BACT|nr:MAG: hypothetical protein A3D08_01310 [Candidatus Roizmanbacteria bacterium RIFCSPHIGHO2_02_FULL_43_11]
MSKFAERRIRHEQQRKAIIVSEQSRFFSDLATLLFFLPEDTGGAFIRRGAANRFRLIDDTVSLYFPGIWLQELQFSVTPYLYAAEVSGLYCIELMIKSFKLNTRNPLHTPPDEAYIRFSPVTDPSSGYCFGLQDEQFYEVYGQERVPPVTITPYTPPYRVRQLISLVDKLVVKYQSDGS